MHKFLVLAVLSVASFVFIGVTAPRGALLLQVQNADPEKLADQHIAVLDQHLNLTAEQKTKLRPIFVEELKKVQATLASSLGAKDRQHELDRIHSEARDRIENVLTPDQRERLLDMFSEDEAPEPRAGRAWI